MELKAKRTFAADQRAEVLAAELCTQLGDESSRTYYRSLARTVPAPLLYEALGQVKETWREGRIRTSRGALFVALVKRRSPRRAGRSPESTIAEQAPNIASGGTAYDR